MVMFWNYYSEVFRLPSTGFYFMLTYGIIFDVLDFALGAMYRGAGSWPALGSGVKSAGAKF